MIIHCFWAVLNISILIQNFRSLILFLMNIQCYWICWRIIQIFHLIRIWMKGFKIESRRFLYRIWLFSPQKRYNRLTSYIKSDAGWTTSSTKASRKRWLPQEKGSCIDTFRSQFFYFFFRIFNICNETRLHVLGVIHS